MSDVHDHERADDTTEFDDWEEEEPRRGVFQALWFRLLLVAVVVVAAGAVSMPYMLASHEPPPPPANATATAAPVTAPSTEAPSAIVQQARASAAVPEAKPAPLPEPKPAPPAVARRPVAASAGATERSAPVARQAPRPEAKAPVPAAPPARTLATPAAAAVPAATPPRPEREPAATVPTAPTRTSGSERGEHWVQVGAFRDPGTAKRLAARLREHHFRVEESTVTAPAPRQAEADPGARYAVVVPTATPADALSRLRALGVSAEPAAEGAVVTPALPLREAVALAKTITGEGLQVQVRRTSEPAAPAPAPATAGALHRVRVGAFADRASALVAVRALEGMGYQPFITREAGDAARATAR